MYNVEDGELKVFPIGFKHGVFEVVSSDHVDIYLSIFDDVLEGLQDLLDVIFWVLSNIHLTQKLSLTYFHPLDLILVIKEHDLARIFNLLNQLLRNFVGDLVYKVLAF